MNDKNKALSTAQDNLQVAQNDLQAKTNDLNNKQQALKNAQDILNNSDVGKAQQALDDANKQVSDDQQALNTAQSNENKAAMDVADAQNAVNVAQNNLDKATQAVNSATKDVQDAQAAQQTAQNAVNQKQSEVDKLNSQLSSVNTITLPAGYADAIKAYSDSQNPDEWAALKNRIQQAATPGMEINTYKHNENDAKIQVDYKNLTSEQRKELSLFAADLINQIRKQFGTQETIITPKSLEWSAAVVKQAYDDANWDAFGEHMIDGKSHNDRGIESASTAYNVYGGVLENMGGALQRWTWDDNGNLYKLPIEQQTMDSLKETIYNDILGMMFDDGSQGWGHSRTFANYGLGILFQILFLVLILINLDMIIIIL